MPIARSPDIVNARPTIGTAVEDGLTVRVEHQEEHQIAPHDVNLRERVRPDDLDAGRVLNLRKDHQPYEHRDHGEDVEGQVKMQDAPAPVLGAPRAHQPVVREDNERKHDGDFLRRERQHPGEDRHHQPADPSANHPPAHRQKRGQKERSADHFGAAGDVPHRLRHHRMHGKQHSRRKRDDARTRLVGSRGSAATAIVGHAPREQIDEHDVEQVAEDTRQVETKGRAAPDRVVDGVTEVHERPRDLVQDDGSEIGQVLERLIADDEALVVVDERIVQRVEIYDRG